MKTLLIIALFIPVTAYAQLSQHDLEHIIFRESLNGRSKPRIRKLGILRPFILKRATRPLQRSRVFLYDTTLSLIRPSPKLYRFKSGHVMLITPSGSNDRTIIYEERNGYFKRLTSEHGTR